MPVKFRTVAIREELFDRLTAQYEKEIKEMEFAPSFAAWVSKLLADQLEERKKRSKSLPQ